jgi:serine/threonine-protein kinase
VEESEDKTSQDEAAPVFEDLHIDVGTDVGGYLIDGEIGRGGMGVVYAATHPVIGKRAAIKVLKRSLSANPATVERFTQEARSVNQIGHPGIVDIFAFGALPDGRRYLVMDLLLGESLRKRLKRGPLHVTEGLQVLDEIASALIAAHGKGFIHRDLKPDNVFLVEHPGRLDVRLLDFGLAKLMPGAGQRAYRTATGVQLGTPDYMSPEQLRASTKLDERTDIFSLGVMAFESITGIRPRRTGADTYNLSGTPSGLIAKMPGVPRELGLLVEQMMTLNPDGRPPLIQVRQTLKKLRPSLPSMSAVDMPIATPQAGDSLELTASRVGAKPVLPTPAGGTTLTVEDLPPHDEDAHAIMTTLRGQPGAGLRKSGTHPSTTLGVPPPPAPAPPSRQHPVASRVRTATTGSENRIWLVIGALLVVAAAVALVLVLAT